MLRHVTGKDGGKTNIYQFLSAQQNHYHIFGPKFLSVDSIREHRSDKRGFPLHSSRQREEVVSDDELPLRYIACLVRSYRTSSFSGIYRDVLQNLQHK